MTEFASRIPWQTYNPPLEPATQEFVDGLAAHGPRIGELATAAARAALVEMQVKPTGKPITVARAIVASVPRASSIYASSVPRKFQIPCLSSCSSTEEAGPWETRPRMIGSLANLPSAFAPSW